MSEVTVKLQEYFFWSPMLGDEAVRFSVFDNRGKEYFAIAQLIAEGKSLRESRAHWALTIHEAMTSGKEPGDVRESHSIPAE